MKGSVELKLNDSENLTVTENGSFTFSTTVGENETYNVVVISNLAEQTCEVTNGTGGISAAHVTNVEVLCTFTSITRVSVDSSGFGSEWDSTYPTINGDGRYIAFASSANNLVPGDINANDIFVHDRLTGLTTRVSVNSSGTAGNNNSYSPSISSDGRYIAFNSYADNLVPGDNNGVIDIFVHDQQTGETTRVCVDSSGNEGNDTSDFPDMSGDGRYVAFNSRASNLVSDDTNGKIDCFVHDRQTGVTFRVNVDSSGNESSFGGSWPSISDNGQFIAFGSANLVAGVTSGRGHIFVRNMQTGEITLVSVDSSGNEGDSWSTRPAISGDGRYVAIDSNSSNLVPNDTNSARDIIVHDRQTGLTTRASVDSSGNEGDSYSWVPSISYDGRYVTFWSPSTNLVPDDTNFTDDTFVHDRITGLTTRVSKNASGTEGNERSYRHSISGDGRYITFDSFASNLVPDDINDKMDVFVATIQ